MISKLGWCPSRDLFPPLAGLQWLADKNSRHEARGLHADIFYKFLPSWTPGSSLYIVRIDAIGQDLYRCSQCGRDTIVDATEASAVVFEPDASYAQVTE